LTPMLVGVLVGTLTKDTTMAAVAPLVVTGIVIFVLAFIIISFVNIPEPQGNLHKARYEHSPLAFRHCLLGVIAIFFYVGIEIGIPGEMNAWISRESFEGAAAVAGSLAALYWLMMLVGRFLSSIISGKVSTRTQMVTVSSVAIALVLSAILLPESVTFKSPEITALGITSGEVPMKCLFLFLCGLCTSVMWGGIFNLATEGLGKYTAKASGIFMMMVVGGGIMPYIQDYIGRTVGYVSSYWLVFAMLVYIFFYSLVGSKNVNRDIPVDEEPIDARNL
ncbi:MAG: MFS transporter, partial [Muribaculaceae bacterium]|nr:MFS transporter [Muribaculaceae bacterium]